MEWYHSQDSADVYKRQLLTMQNDMYKRAAELFANDLYDELNSSGILDNPDIWCGQTDEPIDVYKRQHQYHAEGVFGA